MYPKDIVQELIEGQPKEIISKEGSSDRSVEDLTLDFGMLDASDQESSDSKFLIHESIENND